MGATRRDPLDFALAVLLEGMPSVPPAPIVASPCPHFR
jgi:hypothetical protein